MVIVILSDLKLNGFQGFAIGNGLTDPAIQYKAYTDYALDMDIISKAAYNRINKVLPVCETAIKLCGKFAYETGPLSPFLGRDQMVGWLLSLFWLSTFLFFSFYPGTDGTVSCVASYFVCNTIFSSIIALAGGINVRKQIFCYLDCIVIER